MHIPILESWKDTIVATVFLHYFEGFLKKYFIFGLLKAILQKCFGHYKKIRRRGSIQHVWRSQSRHQKNFWATNGSIFRVYKSDSLVLKSILMRYQIFKTLWQKRILCWRTSRRVCILFQFIKYRSYIPYLRRSFFRRRKKQPFNW